MFLVATGRGAFVSATGTVVRADGDLALVPDDHLGPDFDPTVEFPSDSPTLIRLEPHLPTSIGDRIEATGIWSGVALRTKRLLAAATARASPPQIPASARSRARSAPLPTSLERELLETGVITGRLPLGDGRVEVITDDPERVARLLGPLYGTRLVVTRSTFSRADRDLATEVVRLAESIGVLCGVGFEATPSKPADLAMTLDVPWVPEQIARAAAPVPDGLLIVRSHVTVMDVRA
jgi:hypothetical protein